MKKLWSSENKNETKKFWLSENKNEWKNYDQVKIKMNEKTMVKWK